MKNERYLTQNDAATLSRIAEHLLRMGEVEINAGEQLIDIIATSIILPVDVQRKGYVTLCLLYTSPSPRDLSTSRMPSSA